MATASEISSNSFSCPDCSFSSSSQDGREVRRLKRHLVHDSSIESVSVVRPHPFPPGKKFYCCICEKTIASFPSFKRHFETVHPSTALQVTSHCTICNLDFRNAKSVSAHYKYNHGSNKDLPTLTPPNPNSSPIKSTINRVLPEVSQPPRDTQPGADSPYISSIASPTTELFHRSIDRLQTQSSPQSSTAADDPSAPFNPSCNPVQTPLLSQPVATFQPTSHSPNPTSTHTPDDPLSLSFNDCPSTTTDSNPCGNAVNNPPSISPNRGLNIIDDDSAFVVPPPLSPLSQVPSTHPTSSTNDPDPRQEATHRSSSESNPSIDDFKNKWSATFNINSSWSEFSNYCYEFAKDVFQRSSSNSKTSNPAPRRNDRPSARPIGNNRRCLQFNPIHAKRLQGLYRISKKRAARQILNNSSPSYCGSVDDARSFFENVFDKKNCDTDRLKENLNEFVPSGLPDDSLSAPPSPAEISSKLRSLSNSAPGSDKVEYRHLKAADPKGEVLALIFSRCLAECDVPAEWKTATTVLIHKKGDSANVSNFRPIALMSCIYKLLMSLLASRIVKYSIDNDFLSPSQKSARPSEGCYELTFILQSLVADAQRIHKNLYLAWLDLRNAFGSVPHDVISLTLSHVGIPESIVNIVSNVYTNASTVVRTPNGTTPPIPILAGVKQGCPLSPILFNLCIELILRTVNAKGESLRGGPAKHHGASISVVAYADDLVIISRKQADLQQLLDAASSSASLLGLEFRPEKCASLSMTNSQHIDGNISSHQFMVQDRLIPALSQHEHYRYLGIPIGVIRDVSNIESLVDDLCIDLEKISSSVLAPWQKLDAIRTFVQPCLTYALRAGNPLKRSLINYRRKLIAVVRSICNLPLRATTHYIFASRKVGGLGFQDPLTEVDVQTIVQALKMLSSSDHLVSSIAKAELLQSVRFAARDNPSPSLICDFLSGSLQGNFHPNKIRYRRQSLWTRTRSSCRRLGVIFNVPDHAAPSISSKDSGPILAKICCRFLHHIAQESAAEKLVELPDQGKVGRALSTDKFSNGSSWLFSGLNIRFKDWRFIHRARLNVVPTNQNKARWSDNATACRKCTSEAETLPHILCHCSTHMTDIRARHNRIVERLTKAVRSGVIRLDQPTPDTPDRSRPDIVIEDPEKVTIIDVTCPFENSNGALEEAELKKVEKYDHLKQHFIAKGKQCSVYGFVIGSLGTWHPPNENVLNRLGMTRSYKSLFRKLCCSDVIQGSADIYYKHMSV